MTENDDPAAVGFLFQLFRFPVLAIASLILLEFHVLQRWPAVSALDLGT